MCRSLESIYLYGVCVSVSINECWVGFVELSWRWLKFGVHSVPTRWGNMTTFTTDLTGESIVRLSRKFVEICSGHRGASKGVVVSASSSIGEPSFPSCLSV